MLQMTNNSDTSVYRSSLNLYRLNVNLTLFYQYKANDILVKTY